MTSKLKQKLLNRKDRSRSSGEYSPEISSPQNAQPGPEANAQHQLPAALQDLSLNEKSNQQTDWPLSAQHQPKGVVVGNSNDPYNEAVANKNISREESLLAGDLTDSHAIRIALERHDRDGTQRPSGENARPQGPRPIPHDKPLPETPHQNPALQNQVGTGDERDQVSQRASRKPLVENAEPRNRSFEEGTSHARITSIPIEPDGEHTQRIADAGGIPILPPISRPSPIEFDKQIGAQPAKRTKRVDFVDTGSASRKQMEKTSDEPLDLKGVVDLTNTEDTTIHTKYAPAVTDETVHVNTHEVVQEAITRHIHTHDVYHRILPVKDVEVLRPRHFVPNPGSSGGYSEIPARDAPGGIEGSQKLKKALQDAAEASLLPNKSSPAGRRLFTARTFGPTEGNSRMNEDGTRTEQTWIHHPMLEDGGRRSGQTIPFHFGDSPDMQTDNVTGSRRRRASRGSKGTDAKRGGVVIPQV